MSKTKKEERNKKDIWAFMEDDFREVMGRAEGAYKTNYYINLIIVGIGILFLASSLLVSWISGINVQTISYAGIGITDFTVLFLVNPQKRIQRLLGDLSQVTVIYRTWWEQVSLLDFFLYGDPTNNVPEKWSAMSLEKLADVNQEFRSAAIDSLRNIEDYIGAEDKAPDKKPQDAAPATTQKPAKGVQNRRA